MNRYECLHHQQFSYSSYSLVPLRYSDIFDIKRWRNEQMDILRQKTLLTDEQQQAYYSNVIEPTFVQKKPDQLLFSYLCEGRCIGYGALVRIDWLAKHAEVSFLLNTDYADDVERYECEFSIYLSLIKQVAFDDLHLHRLYTETYDIRPTHIATLEKNGFLFEGRLKDHVWIAGHFVDSLMHGCVNHG